jgi:hypothetical protein
MPLICPHCNSQKIHYVIQSIYNSKGKDEKNLYTIECEQGHHLGIAAMREIDPNKPEKKSGGIIQAVNKVDANRAKKAQEKIAANPIQQKEQPPAYKPVDNGSYGAAKNNQNQVSNTDEPATPVEDPESSDPEADQSLE